MLVEFELEHGRLLSVNADNVAMVSPKYDVWYHTTEQFWRFWVAGYTEIKIVGDGDGGSNYTVCGNYHDVVFKIQEAQSYGKG